MNSIITISFLISTYFIQKRIRVLTYKDIIYTLKEKNYRLKEENSGEVVDILNDYTTTYLVDKILLYLSVLPIFNVIHEIHNTIIYIQEKDIIIDEFDEANVLESINNYNDNAIISDNNIIKNQYYPNDINPKIKIHRKKSR